MLLPFLRHTNIIKLMTEEFANNLFFFKHLPNMSDVDSSLRDNFLNNKNDMKFLESQGQTVPPKSTGQLNWIELNQFIDILIFLKRDWYVTCFKCTSSFYASWTLKYTWSSDWSSFLWIYGSIVTKPPDLCQTINRLYKSYSWSLTSWFN